MLQISGKLLFYFFSNLLLHPIFKFLVMDNILKVHFGATVLLDHRIYLNKVLIKLSLIYDLSSFLFKIIDHIFQEANISLQLLDWPNLTSYIQIFIHKLLAPLQDCRINFYLWRTDATSKKTFEMRVFRQINFKFCRDRQPYLVLILCM